jgi:WD40 repeat protein
MKNKNLDGNETGNSLRAWSQRERKLAAATVISTCTLLFLLIFGKTWEQRVKVSAAQTVTSQAVVVDGMQAALVDTVRDQALAQTQIVDLQDRSQIALARQLATQAQLLFATDDSEGMTALQLATMSIRLFPLAGAVQVVTENDFMYPVSFVEHSWLSNGVSIVGFSSDNSYLITLGQHDDAVHVWKVETGKEVCHVAHSYGAWSADISPSGKYVVSGGGDGWIRIWELETCKESFNLPHNAFVFDVEFSPDGRYIISRDLDGVTQIWMVSSGEEIVRMETRSSNKAPVAIFTSDGTYMVDNAEEVIGDLNSLNIKRINLSGGDFEVSSDGKYVLSGKCEMFLPSYACGQTLVNVWNINTGKIEMSTSYVGELYVLTFSPDSKHILLGGSDENARILEIETGNVVARFSHEEIVYSAIFSPDGEYVLTNDGVGVIRKWAIDTGLQTASAIQQRTGGLAFSPDGIYMASVDGFYVRIWKIDDNINVAQMDFGQKISVVALSPDGSYVAAGSINNVRLDNIVRVWEVETGWEVINMSFDRDITSIAFSPDEEYLAIGLYDHSVRVWSISLKKEIASMWHDDYVKSMSFSPDGKYVLSESNDYAVQVWSVLNGDRVAGVQYFMGTLGSAFNLDGSYAVTVGCDLPDSNNPYGCEQSSLRVWNPVNGQILLRIPYDGIVSLVGFSADGTDAILLNNSAIYSVDLMTGKEVLELSLDDTPLSATLSSDNKYVLSMGLDSAYVWEVATGKEVFQIKDSSSAVFSFDGEYVIAKSVKENVVRVWSVSNKEEIVYRLFEGYPGFVSFVANGKYAVSSNDSSIHIWRYRPEELIADACSRATRNLTRVEWTQYIGDILPYQAVCPNLPIEP